jgi:hypothetical protein
VRRPRWLATVIYVAGKLNARLLDAPYAFAYQSPEVPIVRPKEANAYWELWLVPGKLNATSNRWIRWQRSRVCRPHLDP